MGYGPSIIQKLKFARLFFQILLGSNVFIVSWGLVAVVRYVQNHDPSAVEMVWVGTFTVLFGILIPCLIIYKIQRLSQELVVQTQEKMAKLMAAWLENIKQFNKGGIQSPYLWLNLGLCLGEIFLENHRHPAAKIFIEISPFLRKEIRSKISDSEDGFQKKAI